jgi:tetratricopeptide (TPR) repeat protein
MSKEALVAAVKQINALQSANDHDGATEAYRQLFSQPWFTANKPEHQRQALKMLILAKRTGKATPPLIEAHRAAIPALTELVSTYEEPEDYEMLGICHLLIGNDQAAANMFRQGLTLERARNAASDLCGRLMTRVSSI